MKKYLTFLFFSFLFYTSLMAQDEIWNDSLTPGANFFLRGDFEYGYVLPSDVLLEGVNTNIGGNIEVGWQARGRNVYDNLLRYPTYGAGFLTYHFPQTDSLGKPNAFYLFLNAPFKRTKKWAFNYIIRLGMSYNWEPQDPVVNPGNLVIGGSRNLYISGGIEAQYLIGESLSASLGFKFAHFSNGQSSLPNFGVNLLNPHLGVKYDFNGGERPEYKKYPKPEFTDKAMEYYFTIGTGTRQILFYEDKTGVPDRLAVSYKIHNISVAAQYHYGWLGKYGGGLDVIYWGPYDAQIELGDGNIVKAVEYPFADHLQLGVFLSYEFVFNNISIYAQPGYRILRKEYEGMPTDFYQHLALKYHVRDLILGIAIRAINFGQAEYIEWNIGYRFRKPIKKKK